MLFLRCYYCYLIKFTVVNYNLYGLNKWSLANNFIFGTFSSDKIKYASYHRFNMWIVSVCININAKHFKEKRNEIKQIKSSSIKNRVLKKKKK